MAGEDEKSSITAGNTAEFIFSKQYPLVHFVLNFQVFNLNKCKKNNSIWWLKNNTENRFWTGVVAMWNWNIKMVK